MIDTKKKILDSAQRLIGSQGYAATSVRHIISEAGVNLAAIHYHFGSKEDLLAAIIARKADLVNKERMTLLDRLESEAGAGPLSVKKVLEAWFLPMAEAADGDPGFVLLMGRLMSEGMLQTIVEKHFREPAERITGALRRSLPELPDEEFRWRMHFMFGAMAFTMCGRSEFTGIGGDTRDFGGRIDRLITFLIAGFHAPVSSAGRKEGKR